MLSIGIVKAQNPIIKGQFYSRSYGESLQWKDVPLHRMTFRRLPTNPIS